MHSLRDCVCRMFNVNHAVLIIIIIVFCSEVTVAQIYRKPITGDSLSFAATVAFGIGYGSLDVSTINETLMLSKLPTVESNTLQFALNMKVPIGKGFLLTTELSNYLGVSSYVTDTNGAFTTKLTAYEGSFNLGYSWVHNDMFLVIPSIGYTLGWNTATINFNSTKPFTPIIFDEGVKTELLNQSTRQIEGTTRNINLTLRMEAYLKMFSFGVTTEEVQGLPNRPISSQSRVDFWFGGYASYNPWILASYTNNNLRFNPAGFNFGINVMVLVSERLIAF